MRHRLHLKELPEGGGERKSSAINDPDVGPGARDEFGKVTPLDVKAGDQIIFGKWSGTEVKIAGEELLIMKESDILGIVD